MNQVIFTKGLPASGKSTWAKKQVEKHPGCYKRVNKDDLRAMLDAGKWSKANEKFVESIRDQIILAALESGQHVIVDDTNFAPRHEEHIRQLVKGKGEVSVKFFEADLDECIKRDLQRPVSVGESVIRQMWRQFVFEDPQPPQYVADAPAAIIVDLDGTLAILNGRSPYDASTCESDELCVPVANIVNNWRRQSYGSEKVILLSGRQEKDREPTERWLAKHLIEYDALFMRSTDDQRKDSVIKRELYEKHILGKYNIAFVIDDRDQVVRLWRDELGLQCFQANWGDF